MSSNKFKLFLLKMRISLSAAAKVIVKPQYAVVAIVFMILASALILWSLNLDLVAFILFEAPLSIGEKFDFFFSIYRELYTDYSTSQSTGLIVFSLLFGVNFSLLIYVLKNHGFKSIPKKSGAGGLTFAILGGGCVACGTSLIAPLTATLGAASTPLLRDLAAAFNWVGSALIMYSVYKLGGVISFVQANSGDKGDTKDLHKIK